MFVVLFVYPRAVAHSQPDRIGGRVSASAPSGHVVIERWLTRARRQGLGVIARTARAVIPGAILATSLALAPVGLPLLAPPARSRPLSPRSGSTSRPNEEKHHRQSRSCSPTAPVPGVVRRRRRTGVRQLPSRPPTGRTRWSMRRPTGMPARSNSSGRHAGCRRSSAGGTGTGTGASAARIATCSLPWMPTRTSCGGSTPTCGRRDASDATTA